MWSWRPLAIVLLGAVLASCGADGPPAELAEPELVEATSFRWRTEVIQDGTGYVLTVGGVVGDDHAVYAMQVEPVLGAGDDFLASLAAVTVNGFDEEGGVVTSAGDVSLEGETEVRVLGDERWYRNPWLVDEAADAMDGAEWVRVRSDEAVIADLATAVLNERYDHALRRLLVAVDAGDPIEAPTPDEQASELDEVLTPWVGLRGPAYPVGVDAAVTGDASRGQVEWRQTLTTAEHGFDGTMAGTVEWGGPVDVVRPLEPGPAVEASELAARLEG